MCKLTNPEFDELNNLKRADLTISVSCCNCVHWALCESHSHICKYWMLHMFNHNLRDSLEFEIWRIMDKKIDEECKK